MEVSPTGQIEFETWVPGLSNLGHVFSRQLRQAGPVARMQGCRYYLLFCLLVCLLRITHALWNYEEHLLKPSSDIFDTVGSPHPTPRLLPMRVVVPVNCFPLVVIPELCAG